MNVEDLQGTALTALILAVLQQRQEPAELLPIVRDVLSRAGIRGENLHDFQINNLKQRTRYALRTLRNLGIIKAQTLKNSTLGNYCIYSINKH